MGVFFFWRIDIKKKEEAIYNDMVVAKRVVRA
jgi:hypothetical protein